MPSEGNNPIVHMELHTDNQPRACAFYTALFRWRVETVRMASGSYLALDLGVGIDAGVIESHVDSPVWLPYVEVADVAAATERARQLGAVVTLEPREGPAGWRSVLEAPAGAQIALWQPKP
jgi:uncharacterized protein